MLLTELTWHRRSLYATYRADLTQEIPVCYLQTYRADLSTWHRRSLYATYRADLAQEVPVCYLQS